jgi:hypothetical protein
MFVERLILGRPLSRPGLFQRIGTLELNYWQAREEDVQKLLQYVAARVSNHLVDRARQIRWRQEKEKRVLRDDIPAGFF